MVKLCCSLLLVAVTVLPVAAQGIVNIDYQCNAQLLANIAEQQAVELVHNSAYEEVRKKQEELAYMTGALSSLKTLAETTLSNARGFGPESGVYKSIVNTSSNIGIHASRCSRSLKKSKWAGKGLGLIRVGELVTRSALLGKLFFQIVTDGTVTNPADPKAKVDKEKLNLMSPYERLNMALKISMQLKGIESTLITMNHYFEHNSAATLLASMDRQTWGTLCYSKLMVNQSISKWKRLVEQ